MSSSLSRIPMPTQGLRKPGVSKRRYSKPKSTLLAKDPKYTRRIYESLNIVPLSTEPDFAKNYLQKLEYSFGRDSLKDHSPVCADPDRGCRKFATTLTIGVELLASNQFEEGEHIESPWEELYLKIISHFIEKLWVLKADRSWEAFCKISAFNEQAGGHEQSCQATIHKANMEMFPGSQMFFSTSGLHFPLTLTPPQGHKPDTTYGIPAEGFEGKSAAFWREMFPLAFPFKNTKGQQSKPNLMFPYFIHEVKTRKGDPVEGSNQLLRAMNQCLNNILASLPHDLKNRKEDDTRTVFGLLTHGPNWELYILHLGLREDYPDAKDMRTEEIICDLDDKHDKLNSGAADFEYNNAKMYLRFFRKIAQGTAEKIANSWNADDFLFMVEHLFRHIYETFLPALKILIRKKLGAKIGLGTPCDAGLEICRSSLPLRATKEPLNVVSEHTDQHSQQYQADGTLNMQPCTPPRISRTATRMKSYEEMDEDDNSDENDSDRGDVFDSPWITPSTVASSLNPTPEALSLSTVSSIGPLVTPFHEKVRKAGLQIETRTDLSVGSSKTLRMDYVQPDGRLSPLHYPNLQKRDNTIKEFIMTSADRISDEEMTQARPPTVPKGQRPALERREGFVRPVPNQNTIAVTKRGQRPITILEVSSDGKVQRSLTARKVGSTVKPPSIFTSSRDLPRESPQILRTRKHDAASLESEPSPDFQRNKLTLCKTRLRHIGRFVKRSQPQAIDAAVDEAVDEARDIYPSLDHLLKSVTSTGKLLVNHS